MQVMGLDLGTSGVKGTVLDAQARVTGHAHREYDLIGGAEGRFELNPGELLRQTREVIAEAAGAAGGRVDAITITSFGESFVCLDEFDRPLCNTMIYMDPRGAEECAEYLSLHSAREIFASTGQYVSPMFALYKLRWMRRHAPEVLRRAKRICFIADFIAYMLGAEHCCDYSLAARSAMFHVFEKHWIDGAVAFSSLEPGMLPRPVPGGSVVGEMSGSVARELGLTVRPKLVIGGHDQILAAVGSGAWEVGEIANGMGTVDCLTAVVSREALDFDALLQSNLAVSPYLDTGRYAVFAFNMSGGCAIKWFRDTLAKDVSAHADAYDRLNAEAGSEPTDILVLPYLGGAGTPTMDGETPCAISGLHLGTSRGKLFRAFMEGESYEMMRNIECLKSIGLDVKRIVAVGGGTNSKIWMQIRADMFGVPVYLPRNKEAGTLASAMLSCAGMGAFPSVRDAQRAMVRFDAEFLPDARRHEIYMRNYARYKEFYEAVRAR